MKISKLEHELLEAGNRYTFAGIYIKKYPKIAKANNLDINNYRAWVDFNEDENDKSFTVWMKNGDKHFFDTNFEFLGEKEY